MADFRKWFPVLAVVALLTGAAASANAQAFQCTANAGVPPLLRAEGLAELAGDLVLNCNGVVPSSGILANIRVFLNTNVTSRLTGTGIEIENEALLLIDEPAPGSQVFCAWANAACTGSTTPSFLANVFQGGATGVNTVDWLGIPIVAAGSLGNNRVYRITNVRVNANQLGTSSTLIPTQVVMFVSISGSTSVPVNNPQQIVGFVTPGMTFSVTARSYKQCTPTAEDFDYSPTVDLTYTEGFATSFKAQGSDPQDVPGFVYNTESGFVSSTLTGGTSIGLASQGTRLLARFAGIPSGVALRVPQQVISGGLTLQLVTGTDSAGAGGTVTSGPGTVTVTPSAGAALVVYEVAAATSASWSTVDAVTIPITVRATSVPPGLTSPEATVNGNFAPISTVTVASSSAPVPRFADVSTSKTAFTISPCRTLLLFPFVTNAVGFDTGIAISNTSSDPFGTTPQSGACTLNYFGNIPATGGPAPSAVTTPVIAGGEQLAFTVSSGGGVVGTTKTCSACATPGFHGYVIAVCNFQFAHAFAFVSDLGANKLAEGYLALVIPDVPARDPSNRALSAFGVGVNEGEQLLH